VAARAVRNRLSGQEWIDQSYLAAMTPDGRHLLAVGDRAAALEVDEEKFVFKKIAGLRKYGMFNSGEPFNRFWFIDRWLFPIDLGGDAAADFDFRSDDPKGLKEFAGSPSALHPTLDLVASYSDRLTDVSLVFQSFSKAERLSTIVLKDAGEAIGDPRVFDEDDYVGPPRMTFDPPRSRLFVAYSTSATVVDLTQLDLPKSPLVILDAPRLVTANLDEPLKIPLQLVNRNLATAPKFTLRDAPRTMTIDEQGQLQWTPGPEDVGVHRVKVSAEVKGGSDEVEIEFRVGRPAIEVGLSIANLQLDRTGERALVMGYERSEGDEIVREPKPSFVLIDMASQKVVARRKLLQLPIAAHLSNRAVYLAYHDSTALQRLKLQDLADDGRTLLSDTVQGIASLPGDRLLIQSSGGWLTLDEKTLKSIGKLGPIDGGRFERNFHRDPHELLQPLNEGWLLGDAWVIDDESGKLTLLPYLDDLPEINPRDDWPIEPRLWNRVVHEQGVFDRSNTPIARWDPATVLLLPTMPAVVVARSTASPDEQQIRFVLDFHDLVEGEVRHTVTLAEMRQRELYQQPDHFRFRLDGGSGVLLYAAGDIVVAVLPMLNKLYVVPLPKDRFAELPTPFRFVYRQEKLTAQVAETENLQFSTTGGQGRPTFSLESDVDGVTLDSTAGEVSVDTQRVWDDFVAAIGDPTEARARFGRWENAIKDAQSIYERTFGQETMDFPAVLNLRLAAQDEAGAVDRLTTTLVLLGPIEDVEPALAKLASQKKLAAAGANPAGQPNLAQLAPIVEQLSSAITASDRASRQVERLNENFAELEQSIQDVKKDLEGLRQGPGATQVAALEQRLATAEARMAAQESELTSLRTVENQQGNLDSNVLVGLIVVGILLLFAIVFLAVLLWRRPVRATITP
jgi:hypothetical protein